MGTDSQVGVRPRRDWAGIIEGQQKSGKTAGIYCREHDIPYKLFLYHRRKMHGPSKGKRSVSSSAFIPVELSSARAVLRLSGGVVMECEGLPDVRWLIDLAHGIRGRGPSSC